MPRRINYPLNVLQTRFTVERERIDGMFNGVTQAGHFVEFAVRIKSFGRTNLGAGCTVGWTGIGGKQGVCFYHRVCYHGAQPQKRSVLRMIRLTASSEAAQAGIDRGVFQRQDAPGFKLMKDHRGITGNGDGQMLALGFDIIAEGKG